MQGIYEFGAGGTFDFDITFNPTTNKIVSEVVTAKPGKYLNDRFSKNKL